MPRHIVERPMDRRSCLKWVNIGLEMLIRPGSTSRGELSVPQIEYPLRGSSKKRSHVYFLLHVFWVILLFCQIVLLYDINVVLMSQK